MKPPPRQQVLCVKTFMYHNECSRQNETEMWYEIYTSYSYDCLIIKKPVITYCIINVTLHKTFSVFIFLNVTFSNVHWIMLALPSLTNNCLEFQKTTVLKHSNCTESTNISKNNHFHTDNSKPLCPEWIIRCVQEEVITFYGSNCNNKRKRAMHWTWLKLHKPACIWVCQFFANLP